MPNLREFWDEMEDHDEVRSVEGGIAYKTGAELRWRKWDLLVPTDNIIHGEWTLVKPTPAEIGEERWMRCDDAKDSRFLYQSAGVQWRKGDIENMKDFLYWGGEDLPYGGRWPWNSQVIWIDFVNKSWASSYNKEAGHTEQLVAGWAVMRMGKDE